VAEFSGEQEVSRAVELREPVELVGIEVAEVDLSPRWRKDERQLGFSGEKFIRGLLLPFVLPTARFSARRHFFCKRESSRAALTKSLRTSNGCCEVITVDK
jgi:hypothetical protein